jgi:hypothetical protein
MTRPYEPGHPIVWIETDPHGVRVHRTTVESIQQATEPDTWSVTTARGTETVNETGIGVRALPLDDELEAELHIKGEGYDVTATYVDLVPYLDEDSALAVGGDDLGLG